MSFGNIPANSNSTGHQNVAPNSPIADFPSTNQTSTNNDSAKNSVNPPALKPKKKTPIRLILGGILFVLLLIGGAAGLYLTQMQQDVRQQASGGVYTCWMKDPWVENSNGKCFKTNFSTPCQQSGPNFYSEAACNAPQTAGTPYTCWKIEGNSCKSVAFQTPCHLLPTVFSSEAACNQAKAKASGATHTCWVIVSKGNCSKTSSSTACQPSGPNFPSETACRLFSLNEEPSPTTTPGTNFTCWIKATPGNCIEISSAKACDLLGPKFYNKWVCEAFSKEPSPTPTPTSAPISGSTYTCWVVEENKCNSYVFLSPCTSLGAGVFSSQAACNTAKSKPGGASNECWVKLSTGNCIKTNSSEPCKQSGPNFPTQTVCKNSGTPIPGTEYTCWAVEGANCTPYLSLTQCTSLGAGVFSTEAACNNYLKKPSPTPTPKSTPTPGTGGPKTPVPTQCLPLTAACGSEKGLSDTCCGNGVCQGTHGNRRCEDAQKPIDSLCTGGGSCTGYYGFRCNLLHTTPSSSGQLVCEQNPSQLFTGPGARASALAYAGQCGQIDQVCVGGDRQGQLCGEFSIIKNSCGGSGGGGAPTPTTSPTTQPIPSITPRVSPTPSPSLPPVLSCNSGCTTDQECQSVDPRFVCYQPMPVCPVGSICLPVVPAKVCRLASNPTSTTCQPAVGPMCMSISLNNLSNPGAGTANLKIGDAITLTCGQVNEATRYIFRILQPDGTITNLAATGRTSESFTITKSGRHAAQCQICTGNTPDTCLPYEPFIKPDESATKLDEPIRRPEEAIVKPYDPVARQDDPIANPDGTFAIQDEPVAPQYETSAIPDEESARREEPIVKPFEPLAIE